MRIFVSHSSADNSFVDGLCAWLMENGFIDHFVDNNHIIGGANWQETIVSEIRKSDLLLVIVTKNWLKSDETYAEYRSFLYSEKNVTPIFKVDDLVDLDEKEKVRYSAIRQQIQGIEYTGEYPQPEVLKRLGLSLRHIRKTIKIDTIIEKSKTISMFLVPMLVISIVFSLYFWESIQIFREKWSISSSYFEENVSDLFPKLSDANSIRTEALKFAECKDRSYCAEMVVVPSGNFMMGSFDEDPDPTEVPRHNVSVKAFAVSTTEITHAQWSKCVTATQLEQDRRCKEVPTSSSLANYPIDSISWNDAQTYIAWLNKQIVGHENGPYRLLSESEWEYVSRGVTSIDQPHTYYHWGNDLSEACKYANAVNAEMPPALKISRQAPNCKDTRKLASPVGELLPNRFGLFDTAGNLAEWVEDCWHENYEGSPNDGSARVAILEQSCDRVIRGGSWAGSIDKLRNSARSKLRPDRFGFNVGFRIARDLNWESSDD